MQHKVSSGCLGFISMFIEYHNVSYICLSSIYYSVNIPEEYQASAQIYDNIGPIFILQVACCL